MNNLAEQSLASIVTEKFQSAQILEKYNLDFCCKGKRTLAAACEEKGLPLEQILNELDIVLNNKIDSKNFEQMKAEELISYIILHHHFYVKQALPTITAHLDKVVYKHGSNFPYMIKVLEIFEEVNKELVLHMEKEEMVLFPKIREIELSLNYNKTTGINENDLKMPIDVMEKEHEFVGNALNEIRNLTNNYSILEDMCTTFKLTIAELKEFEENLHQHVHLENNILFPLANKLVNQALKNSIVD